MICFTKPRAEHKTNLLLITPKNRTEIVRKGVKKNFLFQDKQVFTIIEKLMIQDEMDS